MLQFAKHCVTHNVLSAIDPLVETKKPKGKKSLECTKKCVFPVDLAEYRHSDRASIQGYFAAL